MDGKVLYSGQKLQLDKNFQETIEKAVELLKLYDKLSGYENETEIKEKIEKLEEIRDDLSNMIESEFQNDVM